jgi:hypothetical protein
MRAISSRRLSSFSARAAEPARASRAADSASLASASAARHARAVLAAGDRGFGGGQLAAEPGADCLAAFDLAHQRRRLGGDDRALLGDLLEALLHVRQPPRGVAGARFPAGDVGALVRDPLAGDREALVVRGERGGGDCSRPRAASFFACAAASAARPVSGSGRSCFFACAAVSSVSACWRCLGKAASAAASSSDRVASRSRAASAWSSARSAWRSVSAACCVSRSVATKDRLQF